MATEKKRQSKRTRAKPDQTNGTPFEWLGEPGPLAQRDDPPPVEESASPAPSPAQQQPASPPGAASDVPGPPVEPKGGQLPEASPTGDVPAPQAPDLQALFQKVAAKLCPELQMSLLPYVPQDSAKPNLQSKAFLATGGLDVLLALVSDDDATHERMEDVIMADQLASSFMLAKRVDVALTALLNGNELMPGLGTFEKLIRLRETLGKRVDTLVLTRRALSRPGPINVNVTGAGPQQINLTAPGDPPAGSGGQSRQDPPPTGTHSDTSASGRQLNSGEERCAETRPFEKGTVPNE